MAGHASTEFKIEQMEQSHLTGRQKALVGAAIVGNTVEFYDFYIIGFIISIVAKPWQLTFGQTAVVLLSGGVGTILGALIWGAIADRIGRRRCFSWTVLTFSLATGAMALIPDGHWMLFALLRVIVGFGVGGLPVVDIPLIQEFVPSRRRAWLAGLTVVFIPVGLLLGSLSAAFLSDLVGWRGLLLIGVAPALLVFPIRAIVPESPRWLMKQGRFAEARRSIAWVLNLKEDEIVLPVEEQIPVQKRGWTALSGYMRPLLIAASGTFGFLTIVTCIQTWGPTLVSQLLGVSAKEAAGLFIWVSLASLLGRLAWAGRADRIGRRITAAICGFCGAASLIAAAYSGEVMIGSYPMFFVAVVAAYFFCDGVFGMINTFSAEMFPTELRTSGLGVAYGLGSLGKVFGPLLLGVMSGSGNFITPAAARDVLTPVFIILACFSLMSGIIFLFARETKGRTLEELDQGSEPTVLAQPVKVDLSRT